MEIKSETREVECSSYAEFCATKASLKADGWTVIIPTIWWMGNGHCKFICQKMDSTNKPDQGIYDN